MFRQSLLPSLMFACITYTISGFPHPSEVILCGPHSFLCDGRRCVNASTKCDGRPDCADGTDEYDCGPREVPTGETDCQRRHREESAIGNQADLLVPECDETGHYLPLQCFGQATDGSRFCACYDKDFVQIKAPSKKVRSCNCLRRHHEWLQQNGSERENEPRCNTTTGEFQSVQCTSTHHWCVDKETGEPLSRQMSGGCGIDLALTTCAVNETHRGNTEHHDSDQPDSNCGHGSCSDHGSSIHRPS
ncbi:SCO-spondin-like isoform X2 [Haemaphysalis longicornis]